ncbi:hypothetical protein KCTC52924_01646 [Arenibacter antarcticus]|uniref:Beta-lactamase-inhibitor-like, PepSY-like n=1 Tax=Arenibacter antarcticus TaxID=2040469 RepID=A0ABW5VH39_9FLAO|nr:hypothetical protein [Arenibacter sp. H213]MCM4166793.1 hypothetical protein [Arenibacter sp. H213]
MKQLFLGIAISLISLSSCAQDKKPDSIMKITDVAEVSISVDHFAAIDSNTIPKAVKKVITNSYPTAIIKNAFANKAEQYKLEIVLVDGKSGFLYADKYGNWIER